MCTLMEKDVLIEEVSATAAFIAYRTPLNTKSEDLIECSEIRENLLITSPKNINKQNILNRLKLLMKQQGILQLYLNTLQIRPYSMCM